MKKKCQGCQKRPRISIILGTYKWTTYCASCLHNGIYWNWKGQDRITALAVMKKYFEEHPEEALED